MAKTLLGGINPSYVLHPQKITKRCRFSAAPDLDRDALDNTPNRDQSKPPDVTRRSSGTRLCSRVLPKSRCRGAAKPAPPRRTRYRFSTELVVRFGDAPARLSKTEAASRSTEPMRSNTAE